MSDKVAEAKIRRRCDAVTRRQAALDEALAARDDLVRQALARGMSPTALSTLCGISVSRVYQIEKGTRR